MDPTAFRGKSWYVLYSWSPCRNTTVTVKRLVSMKIQKSLLSCFMTNFEFESYCISTTYLVILVILCIKMRWTDMVTVVPVSVSNTGIIRIVLHYLLLCDFMTRPSQVFWRQMIVEKTTLNIIFSSNSETHRQVLMLHKSS